MNVHSQVLEWVLFFYRQINYSDPTINNRCLSLFNEKVMVTGAAGFIGSNISMRLINEGYSVVGIDNFITGDKKNIVELLKEEEFTFSEGDINDIEMLREKMEEVSYVLHQAAIPSVPRSIADPLASNRANIDGTLSVLAAARDCEVEKLVFASSSAVYGKSEDLPIKETSIPNPLSPYALNKLTGEIYCRLFYELYGLKTTSLRYFNVFGPRQNPSSDYAAVIPKFISSIANDEAPVIYGDGTQIRDFVYVEDVVTANIRAMKSGAVGEYNIASGRRTSIVELAEQINEILGKEIQPRFDSPREGDIKYSLADISKAKETFGYCPRFSLEEGLKRTAEWFSR
ncbi:MAG: UDP-glucose 4-epimerase [Candidatus Methanomethylophilaceae archaeon]|nr:UDP-glucose 4-epimerase [Candidatus Methanomethylophilaceae archaeon]